MPRTLNLEQLKGPTRALPLSAQREGEPVLLLRDGERVAVLASPAALETARLGDLPRWEEWLHEMKESITTGGGRSARAISFPEPPLMDKTMLGFDLSTGTLGSDDGRDFLRAELVMLRAPIT